MKLLKSRKIRVVIRASNNHIRTQFVQSKLGGDKILISAFSKELTSKYGWTASTGNIPASYLTGYLAGLRAKNNNIQDAIFDLGIFYHRNRVLATCKGVLDAGIQIPNKEAFFPDNLDERVKGIHIENYAKNLKSDDPEKYEQIFSGYLKEKKADPLKMSRIVADSMKMIENKA
jgi:large subunit ribosomal protein L18